LPENDVCAIYLEKYWKKNRATRRFMGKNAVHQDLNRIKKTLGAKHACYVLITCSDPTKEGKMEVEMSYEGDEMLAAFLIDNASQVFDEKLSVRESK
jgi:hypothetical protein